MPRRAVLALLLLAACAHTPSKPSTPREVRIEMEPMVFQATSSGEVELRDPEHYFTEAGAAFQDKRYDDALRLYDEGLEHFPVSRFVVASLYNTGLTLEAQGRLADATMRYRRLIDYGRAHDATLSDLLDAEFRLAGVWEKLKNWPAAAEAWAQLATRTGPCPANQTCDLTLSDRVEIMARRGAAQVEMRDLRAGERTLRDAQALYKKHEAEERLDNDFYLAMAAYYLGEVAREQYRVLPVRLPEKQLALDLELKARALLSAQQRYLDAMRVNNAEWATAAGFQIANLYRDFYEQIVSVPTPPQLSPEAKELYAVEVKNKIRNLLSKAAAVHERNLLMAERVGAKNDWVRRSSEEMDRLRQLLSAAPTPATAPEPLPAASPPEPADAPKDAPKTH